jgi:hypothetical protein
MAEVWKARHKVPATPSPSEIRVQSIQASRPLSTSAGPSSRPNIKIRIVAGIAAGILICALFVVSFEPTRGRRESLSLSEGTNASPATQAASPVVQGATPIHEAVICMRPGTTEKQLEDFRSSVLAQAGGGNDLPSIVSSYERLSPAQTNGHWAIIIIFRDESRGDEVATYIERINRDSRVDYVKEGCCF